ncbi:MAG: DUF2845 domain-containing protein [Verrucomicrobiae bacterium]|nr:DUF2845 domain-containing protein [Verrucomicrobiae bacterium]
MFLAFLAVSAVIGYIFFLNWKKTERKKRLLLRYKDSELVEKLIQKKIWINQTQEQLLDSLGKPYDIDEKVLKTKKREIWKYKPRGHNRYGLKITLENSYVIGWDLKD